MYCLLRRSRTIGRDIRDWCHYLRMRVVCALRTFNHWRGWLSLRVRWASILSFVVGYRRYSVDGHQMTQAIFVYHDRILVYVFYLAQFGFLMKQF